MSPVHSPQNGMTDSFYDFFFCLSVGRNNILYAKTSLPGQLVINNLYLSFDYDKTNIEK